MAFVHASIAMAAKEPHWNLSDADAKSYGASIAKAMRWFPVAMTQKAMDISAALMTVAMMEGPRIMLSVQLAKQRAQGVRPGPVRAATVYPFPPQHPAQAPAQPAQVPPDGGIEGFTGDGVDGPIGGVH